MSESSFLIESACRPKREAVRIVWLSRSCLATSGVRFAREGFLVLGARRSGAEMRKVRQASGACLLDVCAPSRKALLDDAGNFIVGNVV